MGQNSGTLLSAPIKKNDSNDPYPAYESADGKGTPKNCATLAQLYAVGLYEREWGMSGVVYNDPDTPKNGNYQLTYGYVDINILNNDNWKKSTPLSQAEDGGYLIQNPEDPDKVLGLSGNGISISNNNSYIDINYGGDSSDGLIRVYNGDNRNFVGINHELILFGMQEPGSGGNKTKIIAVVPTRNNTQQLQNDSGIIALTKNLGVEISNTTTRSNLSNTSNWLNKIYTGSAIPNQNKGDYYKDSAFFYLMYTSIIPIRMALM